MGKFDNSNKFRKKDTYRTEKVDFKRSSSDSRPERKFSRAPSDRPSRSSGLELHQAICDKCGRECDLPFKPTSGKPIYCRSCFRSNGPAEPSRGRSEFRDSNRFESRDRNDDFAPKGTSNINAEELDKINKKLDKIMKALKI